MASKGLKKDQLHHLVAPDIAHSQQVARDIQQYLSDEPTEVASWRRQHELPTPEEITKKQSDVTPSLLESQEWVDHESYLRAKYTLLREDGCSPLRGCVHELRSRPHMLETESRTLAKIYESVCFVGATISQKGMSFRVEFSTRRVQKTINWSQSKRLRTGSIVAMSPSNDCFRSICIVASVVARPLRDLVVVPPAKPSVNLQLGCVGHLNFDPQLEWIMVEAANSYWEAYKHTLKALQKMPSESFGLAKYICDGEKAPSCPEYLRDGVGQDAKKSQMKSIQQNLAAMSIKARGNFTPSVQNNNLALDASQEEALQRILNKEMALVQGPPGTGKTTLSVTALKMLLSSKILPSGPIVVVAQTNHALDQMLLLLKEYEPGLVRLGNQTDSEAIKHRALSVLRTRSKKQYAALRDILRESRRHFEGELQDTLAPICQDRAINAKDFFQNGLISEKLYKSFARLRNKWIGEGITEATDPMEIWVGPSLVKYSHWLAHDQIERWDEDEELDEIRADELDLEVDVEDEPWEHLNGREIKFERGYLAGNGSCLKEKEALKLLSGCEDAESIPEKHRIGIYNYLQHKVKESISKKLLALTAKATQLERDARASRMQLDSDFLGATRVIGVTLTGLSKYRGLLLSLKPRIVLIEEAAQTLEPLVSVASMPSVQHLILVGDHMQLRGQINSSHLENAPYYLNQSLFERLVKSGIERSTLRFQRRMRPEIRQLLSPIYPQLVDHASVLHRDDIRGLQHNVFFVEHSWPEAVDEMSSRLNDGEARQVIQFANYLIENGYETRSMSVLTFYSAQRNLLIKHAKATAGTRALASAIHTIDSFQGEESEIVILSLVRNNPYGSIGFLNDLNRVNVALSRARNGLFIFGNPGGLVQNYLWLQTLHVLEDSGKIQKGIPLQCTNHNRKILGETEVDLDLLNGGCLQKCRTTLDCGHTCALSCHPYSHSSVPCEQPCRRKLSCGHFCKHECWYEKHECGFCETATDTMPEYRPPIRNADSLPSHHSKRRSPRRSSPVKTSQTVKNRHQGLLMTDCGKAFRAYANGGAAEDDRQLHEERVRRNKEQLEKMARELSKRPNPQTATSLSSPVNANGTSGRMVWTEKFIPTAVQKRADAIRKESEQAVEDLIDLS